jgi:hypothetical protein
METSKLPQDRTGGLLGGRGGLPSLVPVPIPGIGFRHRPMDRRVEAGRGGCGSAETARIGIGWAPARRSPPITRGPGSAANGFRAEDLPAATAHNNRPDDGVLLQHRRRAGTSNLSNGLAGTKGNVRMFPTDPRRFGPTANSAWSEELVRTGSRTHAPKTDPFRAPSAAGLRECPNSGPPRRRRTPGAGVEGRVRPCGDLDHQRSLHAHGGGHGDTGTSRERSDPDRRSGSVRAGGDPQRLRGVRSEHPAGGDHRRGDRRLRGRSRPLRPGARPLGAVAAHRDAAAAASSHRDRGALGVSERRGRRGGDAGRRRRRAGEAGRRSGTPLRDDPLDRAKTPAGDSGTVGPFDARARRGPGRGC